MFHEEERAFGEMLDKGEEAEEVTNMLVSNKQNKKGVNNRIVLHSDISTKSLFFSGLLNSYKKILKFIHCHYEDNTLH